MSVLLHRHQPSSQLQNSILIDWSNPLTFGLIEAINYAHPITSKQLIQHTKGGNTSDTASLGGRCKAITTAATTNYYQYAGAWSQIGVPFSMLHVYRLNSAPSGGVRVAGNLVSASYGYGLAPDNANFRAIVARSGANTILTGGAVNTKMKTDVIVADATNAYYYENARMIASAAHGGITAASGSFRIGADNGPATSAIAEHYLTLLFNVALSAAQVRALTDNPWQIFLPTRRKIFEHVSVGGAFKAAWARQRSGIIGGI